MAGLGKYHTGGFGRIGVYRDKGFSLSGTPFKHISNKLEPSNVERLLCVNNIMDGQRD